MSEVHQSRVFGKAKVKAEQYLNDPSKLKGLASQANAMATDLGSDSPLTKIWHELLTMFRLLKQVCVGNYTRFPTQSLLLVVAGLIYLIWAVDVIPDAIPVIGWLDDVTLLAFIIRSIKSDLDAFQTWETEQSAVDADALVCLD